MVMMNQPAPNLRDMLPGVSGRTVSVLPQTPDGRPPATGGVPSVLPPRPQGLEYGQGRTVPTVLPTERSEMSGATSVLPTLAPKGGQGTIRGLQSITRQPLPIPSEQQSAMRQIAGLGGTRGTGQLTGVPRRQGIQQRPNTVGFGQPVRQKGPGIRLTGMKLF